MALIENVLDAVPRFDRILPVAVGPAVGVVDEPLDPVVAVIGAE